MWCFPWSKHHTVIQIPQLQFTHFCRIFGSVDLRAFLSRPGPPRGFSYSPCPAPLEKALPRPSLLCTTSIYMQLLPWLINVSAQRILRFIAFVLLLCPLQHQTNIKDTKGKSETSFLGGKQMEQNRKWESFNSVIAFWNQVCAAAI